MEFKKTQIKTDFHLLNKLIYGFPKTGKTTLASMMKVGDKEPLFIATEDGHGALTVFCERVTSWAHFQKYVNDLMASYKEVRERFSCIIIDLVSEIDSMCADYICRSNNVEALADLSYGKGWNLQKEAFQTEIKKIMQILPITFIAHSAEKELMWNGQTIKTQMPSMGKNALEFINGKVDIIGWIIPAHSQEDKPKITFKPSTMCIAGGRFEFMARDFELDPRNLAKSYADIAEFYTTNATKMKGE